MQECIFCKIAKKEIPAKVVYEDDATLSFLDINPRSAGMCIVVPKQHYKDFSENFELSSRVMQAAMIVAEMIKQSLQPKAVDFAVIPSEAVQHFHARVYPVYEDEIPLIENQPKQITDQKLNELRNKISSVSIDASFHTSGPAVKQEKEVEREKAPRQKKRSKKAVFWMRREMEVG